MSNDFIELVTTENQPVFVKKDSVAAIEFVAAGVRTPGHVKLYAGGFKFLIQIEKDELFKKLKTDLEK